MSNLTYDNVCELFLGGVESLTKARPGLNDPTKEALLHRVCNLVELCRKTEALELHGFSLALIVLCEMLMEGRITDALEVLDRAQYPRASVPHGRN